MQPCIAADKQLQEEQQLIPKNIKTLIEFKMSVRTEFVSSSLGLECSDDNTNKQNPLTLIDEEQFDGTSNQQHSDETAKTVKCALLDLDVYESYSIYNLKCLLCEKTMSLSKWKLFVEHLENDHRNNLKPNFDETVDDDNEATESSLTSIKTEDNEKVMESSKFVDVENTLYSEVVKEEESEISSNEEDYRPQIKKPKTESKAKVNAPEYLLNCKKSKVISFSRTEQNVVMEFLKLLQLHPILWQNRHVAVKNFDTALNNVVTQFNAKHPLHEMNLEEVRNSLLRIKDFYKRLTMPEHKRRIRDPALKKKYSDYLKICSDIETKSQNIALKCKLCSKEFFEQLALQVHTFQRHRIGELPFKCKRCQRQFASEAKLSNHEEKDHQESFICETCKCTFYKEKEYFVHLSRHAGGTFVCETCGKIFDSAYRLRRHMRHHEAPKFKCEKCGKMLYQQYSLDEHMKSHNNKREYRCDICFKNFNRQNGLMIHRRNVHKIVSQQIWTSIE